MDLGEDWAKLWPELVAVARRPLRKAFLQAGDEDETRKYPILAREVQRLVGRHRWRRSPGQAATHVIGVAIEDLPDELSGRNPELPHQEDGNNPWRGKPERDIAEFLYGYRDDELPGRELDDGNQAPHTYEGSYLPKALELLGHDKSNSNTRRALRVIREDLAAAILALDPSDNRLLVHRDLLFRAPDRVEKDQNQIVNASEPECELRSADPLVERSVGVTLEQFYHLALEGHPVLCVIGTNAESRDISSHRIATELVFQELRELVRTNFVTMVLSPTLDFSLFLADVLPVSEATEPAAARCLWQPKNRSKALNDLVSDSLTVLRPNNSASAAILALWMTASDSEAIGRLADEQNAVLMVVPNGGDGNSLAGLLQELQQRATSDAAILACQRLSFDDEYTIADSIAGQPVRPGIAKAGCWPKRLKDNLASEVSSNGLYELRGLSGSGKTAMAYYLSYLLNAKETFYVDLNEIGGVDDQSVRRLVDWVEHQHPNSSLILDNIQAAGDAKRNLNKIWSSSPRSITLIVVETVSYESIHQLGGHDGQALQAQREVWATQLEALIDRMREDDSIGIDVIEAARHAETMWHFFYLLRGGTQTLSRDILKYRSNSHADVVYFAVAAGQTFFGQHVDFGGLCDLLDRLGLWPLTVPKDARGHWLLESIILLVRERQVVISGNGLTCRHPLEASTIIRNCAELSGRFTSSSFQDAAVRLFQERLPRIRLDPGWISLANKLRNGSGGIRAFRDAEIDVSKDEIKRAIAEVIMPAAYRQITLERAMPDDRRVQQHVDHVWSDVQVLIEDWPPYLVSHLLSFKVLYGNLEFRFSPFASLRRFRAFEVVPECGGLVDVAFSIANLVGFDLLSDLQWAWGQAFLYRGVESRREAAQGDPALRQKFDLTHGQIRRSIPDILLPGSPACVIDSSPTYWKLDTTAAEAARTPHEYVAALTAAWFNRTSVIFAELSDSFNTPGILTTILRLTDRTDWDLLLFWCWVLMPTAAMRAVVEMPVETRRDLMLRVRTRVEERSRGRYHANDATVGAFVVALALETGELDLYEWARGSVGQGHELAMHIQGYIALRNRNEIRWLGVSAVASS